MLSAIIKICEVDGVICTDEKIDEALENLSFQTMMYHSTYDQSEFDERPVAVQQTINM